MEETLNIDERFKFPYFELTNWYAAQASILETFKGLFYFIIILKEYAFKK